MPEMPDYESYCQECDHPSSEEAVQAWHDILDRDYEMAHGGDV
jgi:hypothetical protein